MNNRVMVTGLGVCAPNAISLPEFKEALSIGKSGIRFFEELKDLKFSCQIGGMPVIPEEKINTYFTPLQLRNFNSAGILYGVIAGVDAWRDAGLEVNPKTTDFERGTIFGMGTLGVDKYRESIYKVDNGDVRRLGSTSVQQTMSSGISAYLGGMLGLGNLVTSNSSACATGTEAILSAYDRIKSGQAKIMLAGSTSDGGPYVWCGFDALRILPSQYNADPQSASRPMDVGASGFVPGCGSGALVLESLESALDRGATIYAEILGGCSNSGGQRAGGSMTAPNPEAVRNCITGALKNSGVLANELDAINGHLTATAMDAQEIQSWAEALKLQGKDFPFINSLKGMTGHCLAAAGSIECVASVLQIKHDFLFPNINVQEVHPDILAIIDSSRIPLGKKDVSIQKIIKASFGFGDVNCCLIFSKY
ncbi:MAG: beta-ketoacyl-[acyl-carrier-protein] synthase family protein [Leeuwenhoekiella sp.]